MSGLDEWTHPDATTPWHCKRCGQWAGPTQDFARRCEERHEREAGQYRKAS